MPPRRSSIPPSPHWLPRNNLRLCADAARNEKSENNPVTNVSNFLKELVVLLPGTVHAHASVLLPHLSSRPYQIRNAVVAVVAIIISAAHENKQDEEARRAPGKQPEEEEGGDGRQVRVNSIAAWVVLGVHSRLGSW